jgi:hypothetical protein
VAVVQAPLTGVQLTGGVAQAPAAQLFAQHCDPVVQAAPTSPQGVWQAWVVGSQTPRQHWLSLVQAAASARQVSLPKAQRGGLTVSSHTLVQQPWPEPELQVSPVGRQSRLARSIWHWPPWQRFEQQSALAVQGSLSTLQSPPPQTPPEQPSEQQSSALVQATPSAKQKLVHWICAGLPVTGSQRVLQHWLPVVQSLPPA